MAQTAADVCNLAFAMYGETGRITSLEEGTTLADEVAPIYEASRSGLLSSYDWNFATRQQILGVSGDVTPEFGFANALALPSDYLRFIGLYNPDYPMTTLRSPRVDSVLHHRLGRYIYADATALNLIYVADVTDPTAFPAAFVRLLAADIAIIQGAGNRSAKAERLYSSYLRQALINNDIQGSTQVITPPRTYQRSRQGGYPADFFQVDY